MTVHIEGMGWLGTALAYRLHAHGVGFTWSDTDSPHVAWRASTGIVYPAGDARSQRNLELWAGWHMAGTLPPGTVVPVLYAYAHRHPPSQGRYPVTDLGWVRAAMAPCYAVDVPAAVETARRQFASCRRPAPPEGGALAIAHGFGRRRTAYVWGWSAAVALDLPEDLLRVAGNRPVALYARHRRFQLAYAYPIAGRPGWHRAGSSAIAQKTPRAGDPGRGLAAWEEAFPQLFPGITVLKTMPAVAGWRPRGSDTDALDLRVHNRSGRCVVEFPPLNHSGVRWAPQLVEQAVDGGGQPASW